MHVYKHSNKMRKQRNISDTAGMYIYTYMCISIYEYTS